MSQKTAILITGMHRCGTSALARTISLLGARLPDELVPPNAGNPDGHWEPRATVELNDRMLADAGSDVYAIADFDPAWFSSPRAGVFREEAERAIATSFAGDPFIVMKDPRTALFLPIWENAFGRLGYRVVHILPLRHPADVASSLRSRHLKDFPYDAWVTPRGELVWLRYTLAAVLGTRASKRVFVRYEELLRDWRGEMRRIAAEADVLWPRLGPGAEADIDQFLRRDRPAAVGHTSNRLASDPASLPPADLAAALFNVLVQHGDAAPQVDGIADAFAHRVGAIRELIAAYESLYPVVWQFYEEAKALRTQIEAARRSEGGLHQAVQTLWSQLTRQTDDKGVLRQTLGSAEERARSFEEALARSNHQFAHERNELVLLAQELRRLLDKEVATRQEIETHLRGEIAQMHTEFARREAELSSLRTHADNLERTLGYVRGSWSWRLTGPMRVAMRGVRKMLGRPA